MIVRRDKPDSITIEDFQWTYQEVIELCNLLGVSAPLVTTDFYSVRVQCFDDHLQPARPKDVADVAQALHLLRPPGMVVEVS